LQADLEGLWRGVKFAGRRTWLGKESRLYRHCDVARNTWYASIPRDEDVEMTKNGNRPKYIVRD